MYFDDLWAMAAMDTVRVRIESRLSRFMSDMVTWRMGTHSGQSVGHVTITSNALSVLGLHLTVGFGLPATCEISRGFPVSAKIRNSFAYKGLW